MIVYQKPNTLIEITATASHAAATKTLTITKRRVDRKHNDHFSVGYIHSQSAYFKETALEALVPPWPTRFGLCNLLGGMVSIDKLEWRKKERKKGEREGKGQ